MPSCPFCAVWMACFDARQNLNPASGLRPGKPTRGIFPLDPLFFVLSSFSFLFFILLNSISHLSPGHIPELPDFMAVLRKNALRARVYLQIKRKEVTIMHDQLLRKLYHCILNDDGETEKFSGSTKEAVDQILNEIGCLDDVKIHDAFYLAASAAEENGFVKGFSTACRMSDEIHGTE